MTVFLRTLGTDDKAELLQEMIDSYRRGRPHQDVYETNPASFKLISNSSFAYWVSENIINLFRTLPRFESEERTVKIGLSTSDDFRFLRIWWEVPATTILDAQKSPISVENIEDFQTWCREQTQHKRWILFAKGGEFSPYYSDLHLIINWKYDGQEVKTWVVSNPSDPRTTHWSRRIANWEFYFRPGLTWPLRTTSGISFRQFNAGSIFGHKGPVVFVPNLLYWMTILQSSAFEALVILQVAAADAAARSYEVGLIQRTPVPEVQSEKTLVLSELTLSSMNLKRTLDTANELSHIFHLPALLQTVSQRFPEQGVFRSEPRRDAICVEHAPHTYRPSGAEDMKGEGVGPHALRPAGANDTAEDDVRLHTLRPAGAMEENLSQGLSTEVAAWNAQVLEARGQLAENQQRIDDEVFRLYGIEGKDRQIIEARTASPKASKDDEDEEELVVDANRLVLNVLSYIFGCAFGRWDIRYATGDKESPELPDPFAPLPVCPPGMLQNAEGLPAEPQDLPQDYPLRITWNGVLVDDEGHPEDIVARVREALEVIWHEKAGDIEQEACEILGVKTLRDYFGNPNKFFAEHLKRYSKSRRQAPIYWPLSTASGSYTLWLYYHRLSDQTLYTCVNDFVNPRLTHAADALADLRRKPERSRQEEKTLEQLLALERELQEFRDELLRVAAFWKPNLNDGVQITAAPLWKLFNLSKWRKTLKATWKKLEKGDYDWAHIAYSIWPERVIRASRTDRSYAIAHGLEDALWEEVESTTKRGKSKTEWMPKALSEEEIQQLIQTKER